MKKQVQLFRPDVLRSGDTKISFVSTVDYLGWFCAGIIMLGITLVVIGSSHVWC